jgi:hypothetical protein
LPEEIKDVKEYVFPGHLSLQVPDIFLAQTDPKAGYWLLDNDQEKRVFAYS